MPPRSAATLTIVKQKNSQDHQVHESPAEHPNNSIAIPRTAGANNRRRTQPYHYPPREQIYAPNEVQQADTFVPRLALLVNGSVVRSSSVPLEE